MIIHNFGLLTHITIQVWPRKGLSWDLQFMFWVAVAPYGLLTHLNRNADLLVAGHSLHLFSFSSRAFIQLVIGIEFLLLTFFIIIARPLTADIR